MKEQKTFAEKHPIANMLLGLLILLLMAAGIIVTIFIIIKWIGTGVSWLLDFLKKIVTTTDKVIIVAMITGGVSIVGVIISSIVAKIVDYQYNVKKYLYDKREKPYEQFIDMIYTIMEDTKKPKEKQMTEEEMVKMINEFSRGLTLWGSNRVIKKWLKYRNGADVRKGSETLLMLEDIIYEMRRDVGLRRKMKKGNMLAFFINDIENLKRK
ncbi:MAG: hypothetical protein NC124_01840 [Clostridium sp.]|nr:hypothetical protein [Clostridium sp.]MCM1534672.1 hypothetical protein [Clostridium sp.]